MSGIAGILHPTQTGSVRRDVEQMLAVLSHRGPERSEVWSAGPVALGHCMLYTTPESLHEELPLAGRQGVVLTADARIDNREELITALSLEPGQSGVITDSEIIFAAYLAWGEGCAERLVGDFAFAIWDAERQKLFCARDHLGVKPFYYCHRPGAFFAFASEIKGLLSLEEVPVAVNETRLADFLMTVLDDHEITSYRDILRLPAAHVLVRDEQGVRLRPYWALDPEKEIRYASEAEYVSRFRELFTEAVRCRLRSAFPVGTQLSGGLDSSSITCVARDLLASQGSERLHTFSNVLDDVPESDESEYINAVLEQGSFEAHFIQADRMGPFSDWDTVTEHEDEAYSGANHFLPRGLIQAQRSAGVRVVLDGFDGDTVVSHGSDRFSELARAGDWATFAREIHALRRNAPGASGRPLLDTFGVAVFRNHVRSGRWLRALRDGSQMHKRFGVSRRELLWDHGVRHLLSGWLAGRRGGGGEGGSPSLRRHRVATYQVASMASPALLDRIRYTDRLQRIAPPVDRSSVTVREAQWAALAGGGVTYVLELCDRTAAAASVELRHPFLDKRLVEFCLAAPSDVKWRDGWGRWLLREAMAGILPDRIARRTSKANMEHAFLRGLRVLDKERIDEFLSSDLADVEDYIDVESLRAAYGRLRNGAPGAGEEGVTFFTGLNIIFWLRRLRSGARLSHPETQECIG